MFNDIRRVGPWSIRFSSVQSLASDSLRPHGLQHARLPCPSPTPGAYSNSCPLSQWCVPTISSSVISFSSCLQSFPASGSFPMNQFFTSGGQSIGTSASASVLPMNILDWFPLGLTGPYRKKCQQLMLFPSLPVPCEATERRPLKCEVLVTQLCLLLCNPKDCSLPGSSVRGILQVRILEWVDIPFSKGSSLLRNQIQVSCIWTVDSLLPEPSGKLSHPNTLIPGLGLDPSFLPPGLWISEMSIKVPWEAFSICKCPLPPQTHQITNSGDEAGQSG